MLRMLKRAGMRIGGRSVPRLEGVAAVVLGLGNPGAEYRSTRHNAGSNAVHELVDSEGGKLRRVGKYVRASRLALKSQKGNGEGETVEFVAAIPRTFMNESGAAASWLLARCGIPPESLIVVHDDLDLPLGTVRLKFGGGAGGHRGVESVIRALGTNSFQRVRIGIGRPPEGSDAVDYVLAPFDPGEEAVARQAIVRASQAVVAAVTLGIDAAMNLYNRADRGAAG